MSTLNLKTLTLTTARPYDNAFDVLEDWIDGQEFYARDEFRDFSIRDFKDINKRFNKIEVLSLNNTLTIPITTVLWQARVKGC